MTMRTKNLIATYSVLVGFMMTAMWTAFALTGEIPELDTRPVEIGLHVAAEFLTAAVLVAGGLGLAFGRRWGHPVNMTGLGMLAYTVVVSPGYYAERGESMFVAMFAVLMALTLLFAMMSILKREELAGRDSPPTRGRTCNQP